MGASTSPGERVTASPDACAEFYDRAFDDVFGYLCRALLGNRSLAEDLTQETFAAVVASVRSGHAELQSIPWVIGVARHKLIDHYRRAESEQRRMALVWARDLGGANTEVDEDLDREDPARVVELLRQLSPSHRLVLLLRYVDELSVEEVATLLRRSVRATESLLVRARKALAASQREIAS